MRLATPGDAEATDARTDITVLHADAATARSLVLARLWTGRTHQVRLHLAGLGSPVLGDRVYGRAAADRLALHAWVVGLSHPTSGHPLWVVAPPPPGFWASAGAPPPGGVLGSALEALGVPADVSSTGDHGVC